MNTTTEGDSPFAMHDASGKIVAVDTWPSYSDTDDDARGSGTTSADRLNYRPLHKATDLDDGCTSRGCNAFKTDHIPIGARIRVGE
jgi:hypothetical protein